MIGVAASTAANLNMLVFMDEAGETPEYMAQLIEQSKQIVDAMTPEEKEAMYRRQAEGWARSEAQWAKDFREGKCRYD